MARKFEKCGETVFCDVSALQVKATIGESCVRGLCDNQWIGLEPSVFRNDSELVEKLELYSVLHLELISSIKEAGTCEVRLQKVQQLGEECQQGVYNWILNNGSNIILQRQTDFIAFEGFSGVVDSEWRDTGSNPPPHGGLFWCFMGGAGSRSSFEQRVCHYSVEFGWSDSAVTHWRYIPLNPDGSSVIDWYKP